MVRTVSVVICTYTPARWDELRAAVASVRAQTVGRTETIVVVDHHDELRERAAAELAADRVIANRHRRGLSGARNTGIEAASGDIVAFLDDDAVAEPEWLCQLTAPYSSERVIGVGGLVVPKWAVTPPAWFPDEFGWVVGCSYRGLPEELIAVRNPIGANMSFRRQPLLDAGGFSTAVGRVGTRPVGCEETEASIRLCRAAPGHPDPPPAVGDRAPPRPGRAHHVALLPEPLLVRGPVKGRSGPPGRAPPSAAIGTALHHAGRSHAASPATSAPPAGTLPDGAEPPRRWPGSR